MKQNCATSWTYSRDFTGIHGQKGVKFECIFILSQTQHLLLLSWCWITTGCARTVRSCNRDKNLSIHKWILKVRVTDGPYHKCNKVFAFLMTFLSTWRLLTMVGGAAKWQGSWKG